jgi:hypothetical protein
MVQVLRIQKHTKLGSDLVLTKNLRIRRSLGSNGFLIRDPECSPPVPQRSILVPVVPPTEEKYWDLYLATKKDQ